MTAFSESELFKLFSCFLQDLKLFTKHKLQHYTSTELEISIFQETSKYIPLFYNCVLLYNFLMAKIKIPAAPAIRRLPSYLHIIRQAEADGLEYISGTAKSDNDENSEVIWLDVNEVQEYAKQHNVEFLVDDVPGDSIFPYLIIGDKVIVGYNETTSEEIINTINRINYNQPNIYQNQNNLLNGINNNNLGYAYLKNKQFEESVDYLVAALEINIKRLSDNFAFMSSEIKDDKIERLKLLSFETKRIFIFSS